MRADAFTFEADDARAIHVYRFLPDGEAKAVVHVAHGLAEHAARYARLADALTRAGYAVYADDHRGHGKTTRTEDLGWFADRDGFSRVARDIVELIRHEKKEHPGLPLVLFGHSMGSYLTQQILTEHGDLLAGAVLSGTGGKPNLLASAGRILARAERARLGPRGKSPILDKMSFERFNKGFAPNCTGFDWLSRDEAEVDKYIADPLCGFVSTTSLWVDLLDGLARIAEPKRQARIPKELPIYVFSGSRDPVGEDTKGVQQLLGAYRSAGLRNVTHTFYPEGRHEMLNETNRDQVVRELVAWLDAKIAS